MPKSTLTRRINPEIVDRVMQILFEPNKEQIYNEKEGLSFYVSKYEKNQEGFKGTVLIDYPQKVAIKKRNGGDISISEESVKSVAEIHYREFHEIHGSGSISHLFLILGSMNESKLMEMALNNLVGEVSMFRVNFTFSVANQNKIQNNFDDVVRIRGDGVADESIRDLSLVGTALYNSNEYKKAFTGDIQYLGLKMYNNWFIVKRDGTITTYRPMSEDDYTSLVKEIVSRLLKSDAVNP